MPSNSPVRPFGLGAFLMRSFFWLGLMLLIPLTAFLQEKTPPVVGKVEAQPLLAQANRLSKALELLGEPLAAGSLQELTHLTEKDGDEKVTSTIQKIFDPLTIATVELNKEGIARVTPTANKVELLEQGWRIYLVKVINKEGIKTPFRTESPNALPLANSPKDDVENRWLGLADYTGQPLLPNLSGLELEYRVVQLYGRHSGEQKAKLHFATAPAKKGEPPIAERARCEIPFVVKPSVEVRFRVRDEKGENTMAAFVIRDAQGRIYPAQSKRLAPDFFFQRQIYRETGETIRLPVGKYQVECSRGPESIPESKEITVTEKGGLIDYQVQRWVDPAAKGWWSGDHHIHAAGCAHYEKPTEGVHPPDMLRHIRGEDLKVGCCLTWGPCFDYQKQFFTGKPDNVSKYPYLLRYDVEVSGFGSHASGHLNLLKLREQIYPGGDSKTHWPTLGMNTLRWAKSQGAITGPAHSANGLTRYVGKIPQGQEGPNQLPNFHIPAYDGIGANEFIVQVTHLVPGPDKKLVPAVDFISAMDTDRVAEWNMWYHTLNCGYRVRVSGETDFPCIYGERVGIGRVYVKLDGKLDFDQWTDGIAAGRSYVSDGTTHLMDFAGQVGEKKYELGVNGSEIKLEQPQKVRFTVEVASRLNGKKVPIELVVNGYPVEKKEIVADGKLNALSFETEIKQSSWVAVRCFPHAHTNPIFVLVGEKPIRANRASVEWCLQGVEQCWKMKKGTYKKEELEQAEKDYEHARKAYQKILEEHPKD